MTRRDRETLFGLVVFFMGVAAGAVESTGTALVIGLVAGVVVATRALRIASGAAEGSQT